jgi:heterodisulfide reductase subunit D
MWAEEYRPEGIELLHSTQFIERLIESGRLEFAGFSGSVTYHDPCDLGRRAEIYASPRKILQSIPGIKFTELKSHREEGLCCGGGRLLDMIHPDISSAVSGRLGQAIRASGTDVCIDACPQCKRMIAPKTNKAVKDIVEVVNELGKYKK